MDKIKIVLFIIIFIFLTPNLSYSQPSSDPNDFAQIHGSIWGFCYEGVFYGDIFDNKFPLDFYIGFYNDFSDQNNYSELATFCLKPTIDNWELWTSGVTTYQDGYYYCTLPDLPYSKYKIKLKFTIDNNIARGEYFYIIDDVEIENKLITGIKINDFSQDQNQPITLDIIKPQHKPPSVNTLNNKDEDIGCFIQVLSHKYKVL